MTDLVIEVSDIDFKEKVLENPLPVFVDFWTPWCGPCQSMGAVIADMALQFGERMVFAKCNVDAHPDMMKPYGIESIPTFIIFRKGAPVHVTIGTIPRSKAAAIIQNVLNEKEMS